MKSSTYDNIRLTIDLNNMSRKHCRVKDLAEEARMDFDETLVLLWDTGIGYVEDINHSIRKRDLNRARRALGIATRRELSSLDYWCQSFNMTEEDFKNLLLDLGINMKVGAKRLPKGAVVKLKTEAQRRGATQILKDIDGPDVEAVKNEKKGLEWEIIGQPRDMRIIEENEVTKIHFALVEDFKEHNDPIHPEGVRSDSLLSSAVHRPRTSLGNELKYPTVEMAAAALLHSLVLDHPFHNGNKRTALVSMLVFLDENKFLLTCTEKDLFKLVLLTAQHRLPESHYIRPSDLADQEVLYIAKWISSNSRIMELGDRAIQWRRLKRILRNHDCELQQATVGNRINIIRKKEERGFLGRTRTITLQTQVFYRGDGFDAEENTVVKIRKDLYLDKENGGIDTRAFYQAVPYSPDDFIVKYSKTLKRLSRL